MVKLECVIVHRSIPLVSILFVFSLTCHPDDLYYFSDVRDGEIVCKQSTVRVIIKFPPNARARTCRTPVCVVL